MKVFLASVKREKNDLSKSSQVTAATEFKHDDIELKTQEIQFSGQSIRRGDNFKVIDF